MAQKALKDVWLEDLEVDEVSVVDAAANRRKFIIVKSASGTPPADPAPANDPPTPAPTPAPAPEPTQVEKKGAKMAKERLARFKTAIESLSGVAKDLSGIASELEPALQEMADAFEALEADGVKKNATPSEAERAAVEKAAGLEAQVASLNTALTGLKEQVAALERDKTTLETTVSKQKETIAKARFDALGNSTPVESDGDSKPKPKPVTFGHDFNETLKREGQQSAG
jgi:hypothetical protein